MASKISELKIYILMQPPKWRLIPSEYPETTERFLITTMDEEEMLVEKIISLMKRNKGRDLYDTWFLLEKGVKINKELFTKKTSSILNLENIPSEKEYTRDLEKLTDRIIPYNQIKRELQKELKILQ